jgi:putative endonuclease
MKLGHSYYVYIVECSDKSYYTGMCNDLERRIAEHNEGINPEAYTFLRRPVYLKYFEHFIDVMQAIEREKQLKRCSRKKKEALMAENYELLKELSKNTLRQAQGDKGENNQRK